MRYLKTLAALLFIVSLAAGCNRINTIKNLTEKRMQKNRVTLVRTPRGASERDERWFAETHGIPEFMVRLAGRRRWPKFLRTTLVRHWVD